MDILWYVLHPRILNNPTCKFPCTVSLPDLKVCFFVRKGSDDIWSILPQREGDVHDAILNPLEKGDIFIDVGANIGYYSVVASRRVGPEGRVVAIEACPDTARQLRKNVHLNRCTNIEIVEAAAWSCSGASVSLRFAKGHWGQASVYGQGDSIVKVMTKCLDDICAAYPQIKVLKLDIEGAEYEALQGARNTLRRCEYIVAEGGQNLDKISSILGEMGFKVRRLKFTTYILAERKHA
jgi:FkbM family methyltransferase